VAAVVAAAAVIGRKIAIRPKREDDWTVVPNLWGLVVGRPGIMKTPALQEALKPLYRLVADARHEYQQKMRERDFHMAEAQARREARKKKLREAIENKQSIDELRHAFEAPSYVAPTERRYVVNDSTVEKLGELLNQNRNGLLLFRDELTGLLQTMDRQGHENDRAFYCEAWNGTGPYTYDRIGRGTLHIEAACISILGGIQPGPLHRYLREVFGEGQDDGLIQRFQLIVYPDTGGPWRNVDRWPDAMAKHGALAVFNQLNAMDPTEIAAHELSPDELPFLRFTPEGQEVFNEWRTGLEAKIRSDDEHPVIISHLAKYRSLMPTLALILHVIECVAEGTGGPVSQAAAARAVAWCTYLEAHAQRVYQSVTVAGRIAAALLAAKLKANKLPNPFRVRDVYRAGWAGLGDREDVVRAVEVLEDLHWIRRQDVRPPEGGRPTAHFHINPKAVG
jgi:putative DNA primase/helicase